MSPATHTQRMDGRVVLVTGGTAGIGRAAALHMATLGASVAVTGRDRNRGSATERALLAAGSPAPRFLEADHSTMVGNLALAAELAECVERLDVLVNNVGGLIPERTTTADGAELTLALNVRAPVVLTEELLHLLRRPDNQDGSLVLNVASDAYTRFSGDPFEDLDAAADYQPFSAYARAKLLLVLATLGHALRLRHDGVRVFAANPGPAWTPGTQALTPSSVPAPRFMWPIVRLVQRSRSPGRAARILAELAAAPDLVVGERQTGQFVTAGGKVRDLGPLASDVERQNRALQAARSLGTSVVHEPGRNDA